MKDLFKLILNFFKAYFKIKEMFTSNFFKGMDKEA